MISLANLKLKKIKGCLDTKKEIQEARKKLEESTEKNLNRHQKSKFQAWARSRFLVLG